MCRTYTKHVFMTAFWHTWTNSVLCTGMQAFVIFCTQTIFWLYVNVYWCPVFFGILHWIPNIFWPLTAFRPNHTLDCLQTCCMLYSWDSPRMSSWSSSSAEFLPLYSPWMFVPFTHIIKVTVDTYYHNLSQTRVMGSTPQVGLKIKYWSGLPLCFHRLHGTCIHRIVFHVRWNPLWFLVLLHSQF